MADGILDGISNAVGGVGDFFLNRGRYADPNAMNAQFGVPEQDVRQAGINTLANVSALLLAAGQPMTGNQRAQLLAGIGPALGGMQTDIFKASQARLMTAQQREKMDELREIQAINDRRRTDPASLAKAMGLSEDLVKTMDGRTLRDIAKQVTIKRASTSPAQQAASARLAQIIGIGGAGMTPSPAAQPSATETPAAPATAPVGVAPTMAAPPSVVGELAAVGTDISGMSAQRARAIASDPIIMAGNPEMAKTYAELADKLETPGTREAGVLQARSRATRLENLPKLELSLANRQLQTSNVKEKIDEAIANTSIVSAGPASATSGLGATPANTLKGALETIRSNIGFSELQKMRDESPTGGALGQVAVQELNYLQAALGSLDQSQKPEVLISNLKKIKNILDRYEKIRVNAFERDYGRKPDIERLLRDPEAVEQKAAAAGATPPAQASGSAPRVTREQFNALPSGSLFIAADDPTGQIRRKP
jgi:hypothetical protein